MAKKWAEPLVYLCGNWISLAGVILVTTASVLWLVLLPVLVRGSVDNPYTGILLFLLLPGVFFAGLALIPLGIWLRWRKERHLGKYPSTFPAINIQNVAFRRLLFFVLATTVVNVVIAGQFTYSTVTYMESVEFCGKTCHSVMEPEYTAYQNSPHSRVECVSCHIGPGASWFVKSKLSGAYQVYSVIAKAYETPIPVPVHNLRPARETCETCHWPQKYGGDRLRIISKFADDEANTQTRTVLLMHIGGSGGGNEAAGIHGAHLGPGVRIRYAHDGYDRQKIPWVEHRAAGGQIDTFVASGADPKQIASLPVREMDCMDCHTRPSHAFQLPERAMDEALAAGRISSKLPFVRKQGVEILKGGYTSAEQARREIPARLIAYYKDKHPDVYTSHRSDVESAGSAVFALWKRNVFPAMKITWGTYPNHIGHTDFPGCFRCHDDDHKSTAGKAITQDCNTCHNLLAMEEPAPKILTELGLEGPSGSN